MIFGLLILGYSDALWVLTIPVDPSRLLHWTSAYGDLLDPVGPCWTLLDPLDPLDPAGPAEPAGPRWTLLDPAGPRWTR